MKIVIAPDSFKGSLSATEVARAIAAGVRDVFGEEADVVVIPMADGGEGTLEAIAASWGVALETVATVDAIGRPIVARFGISADGRRAIIEAAESNGLPAVSDVPLQPLRADTFGVGLIARAVLDRGVDSILVCVGGSATTDGGTGMLAALGVRFLAADGGEVAAGGGGLARIVAVDAAGLHPRALAVQWSIAVDVDNPLCGERGAAATFGRQKGATPGDIALLDAGLANLARVLQEATGIGNLTGIGRGAAGGLPLSLGAFCDASLESGSTLVAETIGLTNALAGAELVFTGEGSFDEQSLAGKVVTGVISATPTGCPVVVIAGRVDLSPAQTRAAGVTAAFSIANGASDLLSLMAQSKSRIRETAAQICSLLEARGGSPRFLDD
jgi:glycerate kinase